jgi:peptidyl-prolyl cis-trans isomerase SurA
MTIAGEPVKVSEFNYVYNKNNSNAADANTEASIKEYLELFTNFRLKVKEAEALGLDSTQSFKKELEGYKKQLAQPYLTEKSATDILAKEAYERMKEEVNAAHILISVGPEASAEDTLKAYNKIVEIRNRALANESFEKLAVENSQDPSAKMNNGDLGYFTALQMVYPFENAAFNTKVGSISNIVRTRFGYHILKVKNRRKSQGQVLVSHIMIRAAAGIPLSDSTAAKQKIDEIYTRIKKGESWNVLCEQFSEDVNSKSKGGELPWFTTGRMIPSFEEAAFSLANTGDYSAPINTPYGWHIIKLLDKKPLETYAELESSIKTKVGKDSRSDLNKTMLLQRLKKENNYVEFPTAIEKAVTFADTTLLMGLWTKTVDASNNATLFTINGSKYTINDFFKHLSNNNRRLKEKNNVSPNQFMRNQYKTYAEDKLIAYEESVLETKYEDYKMLVREYRDGILLFQLMDEKVWTKAIEDTVGLKEYHKNNASNYKWDTRATATIYSLQSEKDLPKLKQEVAKGIYPISSIILANSFFKSNSAELDESAKKAADEVYSKLKADKTYTVELSGKIDSKESKSKSTIGSKRSRAVFDYLVSKGLDSSRIKIVGANQQFKKGDKNNDLDRAVSYNLFSKSNKALEGIFNESDALNLQITEGTFQKNDNDILKSLDWKVGEFNTTKDGRSYYTVISKVEAPRLKTFEEAKGLIISDYQSYLEKEWIKSLKQKYPVVINQTEVNNLVKKK